MPRPYSDRKFVNLPEPEMNHAYIAKYVFFDQPQGQYYVQIWLVDFFRLVEKTLASVDYND